MYTDFALRFSIDNNHKDYNKVLNLLSHMTTMGVDHLCKLPDHPFFSTNRWDMMAKSGRSIIKGFPYTDNTEIMLIGDFKNYDDEINLFIDWIAPYLYDCLTGYSHYEDSMHTTPYFVEAP